MSDAAFPHPHPEARAQRASKEAPACAAVPAKLRRRTARTAALTCACFEARSARASARGLWFARAAGVRKGREADRAPSPSLTLGTSPAGGGGESPRLSSPACGGGAERSEAEGAFPRSAKGRVQTVDQAKANS